MNHLGIDLSKAYFDATYQDAKGQQEHGQFENKPSGFAALQKWLKSLGAGTVHACMEATNIYWEALADYLYEQGHAVSVVNPAQIKGFGMSQMQRNKTDKVDSRVIVAFCAALAPPRWQPPSALERKLRRRVRHRQALVKSQTQHKNRLADCQDEFVRQSLQTILATLQREIQRVDAEIIALIQGDPDLKQKKAWLKSIIGFGDQTVHLLLAEMYDLANYANAHAAAADAGVHPAHYQSGRTIYKKSRMCKVGKATVRGALYLPALTAMRHNPLIIQFVQRLQDKGKSTMVIIGAVMRKLIHLAYGVLKNRSPFDPNWHNQHA
ncbi:MAG: IS110 family transposase [Caldilineaceae bacterium]|nr:IS110 family transposase [Caldilineaceae bacterium]MCB0087576.1 IS110 family transposase [Caldilineaceae bacterium]MCB0094639.1 IS110 family transposase [Caldilineaceae bacterium]MCB9149233.1 IS110 family transposase [Caldilineaceae bacterium]